LHRTDPIYLAKGIKEQIEILTEKAKKHVVATSKRQSNGTTSVAHQKKRATDVSETQNGNEGGDSEHEEAEEEKAMMKKRVSKVAPAPALVKVPKVDKRVSRNKSRKLEVASDEEEEGEGDEVTREDEEEFEPEKKPSAKRGRRA
jgi:hypothetical protein